jgi:hypothetical protein
MATKAKRFTDRLPANIFIPPEMIAPRAARHEVDAAFLS